MGHANLIAYTQATDTGGDIFVMDRTTDPPRVYRVTETPGTAFLPRWSPDLRFVAYLYHDPAAGVIDLWLHDNGDVSDSALSRGGIAGLDERSLSWSPDSRFLLYSAAQPDGMERDIYRVEISTGQTVNLAANSPVWDSAPAWSPDGRFVAYQFTASGEQDVYVIAVAGGEGVNVSNLPGEDYALSWCPDARSLLFTNDSARGPALYVAARDGTDTRPLLELPGNGLGEWAPAP